MINSWFLPSEEQTSILIGRTNPVQNKQTKVLTFSGAKKFSKVVASIYIPIAEEKNSPCWHLEFSLFLGILVDLMRVQASKGH